MKDVMVGYVKKTNRYVVLIDVFSSSFIKLSKQYGCSHFSSIDDAIVYNISHGLKKLMNAPI